MNKRRSGSFARASDRHRPRRRTPTGARQLAAAQTGASWRQKLLTGPSFNVTATAILLITSAYWAILGARVQMQNADQLIGGQLFRPGLNLSNAVLPGSHSFLIKWPLFYLAGGLGNRPWILVLLTTFVVLLTVVGLALLLFKINRRPNVYGYLVLAMASFLLFVPPTPYSGAILPVNMAMIATRNLEYLVFIGALTLLAQRPLGRRYGLWALVLLTLLFASDRLFLTIALGGSAAAAVFYGLLRRRQWLKMALAWLLVSLVAGLLSQLLLRGVNGLHLVTIAWENGGIPFGAINSVRSLALGWLFGGLGLLTNFGANPAFDVQLIRNYPLTAWHRLASLAGLGLVVNLLVLGWLARAVGRLAWRHRRIDSPSILDDRAYVLAVWLLWSALAAVVAFVASEHYYVVDARYLAIILPAVLVAVAAGWRTGGWPWPLSPRPMKFILMLAIISGLIFAARTAAAAVQASRDIAQRDRFIAQSLQARPVTVLVGDYWRTVAIKNQLPGQNIYPLGDCANRRAVLTSRSWQADIKAQTFALLLPLQKSPTGFPACSLSTALGTYGKPTVVQTVAGSPDQPLELLLFYERPDQAGHGANPIPATSSNAVGPVDIGKLMPVCGAGRVIMAVVAHQDDDLLFMNPDISRALKNGDCLRVVYLTAGDAGSNQAYWLARERGSEAAYNVLLGRPANALWLERPFRLDSTHYGQIGRPADSKRLTLVFLRLPDGNVNGAGFAQYQYASLQKLLDGRQNALTSVDGQSNYTAEQLLALVEALLRRWQPQQILAQLPYSPSAVSPDHSDHLASGRLLRRVLSRNGDLSSVPVNYYMGYAARDRSANVSGSELELKKAAFDAYDYHDRAVCVSNNYTCSPAPNYLLYLARQYTAVPVAPPAAAVPPAAKSPSRTSPGPAVIHRPARSQP